MSLRRLIDDVRGREKTLTVHAPRDADVVAAVREYFDSQNVAVEHQLTHGDSRAVLADDGEELAVVGADALHELTARDLHEVGESAPYSPLLEHLDGTTFTSYDRRQMTMASREIEDRAWRANRGQLHSGFQRLSNVARERTTYDRLASSDIDVHVYGTPDATVEDAAFSVHGWDSEELSSMWFVLFDGGGNREQSSALIAEERSDGGFYGFWTYDPELVDRALAGLEAYRQPA